MRKAKSTRADKPAPAQCPEHDPQLCNQCTEDAYLRPTTPYVPDPNTTYRYYLPRFVTGRS